MDKKKNKSNATTSGSPKVTKSTSSHKGSASGDKPTKKVTNIDNAVEKKYLGNLKSFALLVKEILETKQDEKISSKTKKQTNPLIEAANRYIKSLDTANCNVSIHHKLYTEYYKDYSKYILKSDKNPSWMNEQKNSINIQLGKGTAFENKNITLKISVACNTALKMKSDIDDTEYDNPNDREEAMGNYVYQFVDLFYYRLLMVIRDALEVSDEEHPDLKKIDKLILHHREKTHLKPSSGSSSSSDEDTGAAGIGNFLKNVTGSQNFPSKSITKTLEDITSNPEVKDKLATTFDTIEKKSKGNKKLDGKEMFSSVMEDLAPALGGIFDVISNTTEQTEKKTKTTEHVSSDTESSGSTEDS
jgi:hypothetical protein